MINATTPVRRWNARPSQAPTRLTAVAVAAMLCAIPGPALTAQAPCSDVSGSYDVMVTLPGGGPTAIILELEQEECGLTGFVGLTSRIPIQNGTVSDSTASFTFWLRAS